jgi:hypothetical protein
VRTLTSKTCVCHKRIVSAVTPGPEIKDSRGCNSLRVDATTCVWMQQQLSVSTLVWWLPHHASIMRRLVQDWCLRRRRRNGRIHDNGSFVVMKFFSSYKIVELSICKFMFASLQIKSPSCKITSASWRPMSHAHTSRQSVTCIKHGVTTASTRGVCNNRTPCVHYSAKIFVEY